MIIVVNFKAIISTDSNAIEPRVTIFPSNYKSISANWFAYVFSTVPTCSNFTKVASVIRIQVSVITCFPGFIPRLKVNLAVSTETY